MAKRFTEKQVKELIEIARKADLEGYDFLLQFKIEEIQEGFNGIGPEFISEEAREKISQKLDIFLAAAMIHDMRNYISDGTREGFLRANYEFRRNCMKLSDYKYGMLDRKRYRARLISELLYLFVSTDCFGWKAWLEAWQRRYEKMRRNLPNASAEGGNKKLTKGKK